MLFVAAWVASHLARGPLGDLDAALGRVCLKLLRMVIQQQRRRRPMAAAAARTCSARTVQLTEAYKQRVGHKSTHTVTHTNNYTQLHPCVPCKLQRQPQVLTLELCPEAAELLEEQGLAGYYRRLPVREGRVHLMG